MLGYAGWYSKKFYREILFFIPFQQLFLLGPIIFFYTRSLLNKDFKISQKHLIHLVPSFIYLIYSLVIFITDKWVLDEYYFYADGRDKDLAFWYQMSGLISMLFYLMLSLKYYSNYIKFVVQEASYADEILFKWIRHFMIALTFILILRTFLFILNPEWGEFGSKYWYYLCFSILFFFIAITGYSNTVRATISLPRSLPIDFDVKTGFSTSKNQPEQNDNLPNIADWKTKLLTLIETEKIYTNPNLTLTDIALKLKTNRNIISHVINKGFKMNFNDFINSKRVDAVIARINDGEHNSNTFLAIALSCGFNSKATFNRAFKKHTSVTPKEYISKNLL